MAVDPIDVKIVPAVLTNDPAEFQREFTEYPKFARRIQLDVSDGTLAPDKTIELGAIAQLPTGCDVDIHLISANPSVHVDQILRLKPHLCIMHAEASEDLLPTFEKLKAAGVHVGVALLKQTFPGKARTLVQSAQHVLIFSGELGRQGGTADFLQIEKTKPIRSLNPSVEIGWDGGADLTNIRALAHADINVINVGSALSKAEDPSAMFQQLSEEKMRRGIAL